MKRISILLFGLLLTASAAFSPVTVSNAPFIDGKLNDECWKSAPVATDFTIVKDPAHPIATRKTEAQMVYTNTSVVFGVKCYVPRERLPKEEDSSKRPYHTDCIEVMLNPSESDDGYMHFIVNSLNSSMAQTREQGGAVGNLSWSCEYRTAVHREPAFWSVEIEIPFASMEIPDAQANFWRLNVMRESYNLDHCYQEVSTMSGRDHIASSFLRIPPPENRKPYCWGIDQAMLNEQMQDGKQNVVVKNNVENLTGAPWDLVYEARLQHADGGIATATRCNVSLAAGEKRLVASPAIQVEKCGRYQGRVTIRDRKTNRLLASRLFSKKVDFIPLKVAFIDPHYRDAIFESQKLDKVRGTVTMGASGNAAKMRVSIRKKGETTPVLSQEYPFKPVTEFAFDNGKLPYGRLELVAAAQDAAGKNLAETVKPFRKLEYRPWEMWRGKDGAWRRGGKRIFILGLWGRDERYIYSEYNLALMPSKNPGTYRLLHLFTGANARLLRKEGVSENTRRAWGKLVTDNMNDERVMVYYMMDEPTIGGFSPDLLDELAVYLRDLDPYRPLMISTTAGGNNLFLDCAELNGLHTYHITSRANKMANFSKMGFHLDRWRRTFDASPANKKQDVVWMHQGFNYADAGVRESPIPSYDAYRSQNLCALTIGACGIVQYNRNEEQFPELYVGLPHLNAELKLIGNEAICQPAAESKPVASDPNLRLLGKRNENNGCHWLLAANFSDETREYTIEFAPFGNKAVQVLSAGRKAKFANGKLTERFTPWEVKVYTDSTADFKLPTVDEINAKIEREYEARKKPGNLAYQRFENETVTFMASSNAFKHLYNEVSLWHLADGVTSGKPCFNSHSFGVVASKDATPGKTPDWIEMIFPKPQTIGRIVVYPAEDSLKEYEVQAEINGKYVTLSKVADAKGLAQEHTFAPVKTNKIRIFVTATRGQHTRLYEIEAYEK